MKLQWQIDEEDIQRIQAVVLKYGTNELVKERKRRNLAEPKPTVTREIFWTRLVACLLTTQQRSGPNAPISNFLSLSPFPLNLSKCVDRPDLVEYASATLKEFGGIRFTTKIPKELAKNIRQLDNENWPVIDVELESLRMEESMAAERRAARLIQDRFKGFGPKQSRNLLQFLGLTRYVIPIDSRITKWLNQFGFPVKLSATPLGDLAYYEFIEDGVYELCRAADVYPCILDAAIFVSSERDEWTKEMAKW